MADEKPDFVNDLLTGNEAVIRPNKDGVMPVMCVGRRARDSKEIEMRARAIKAQPVQRNGAISRTGWLLQLHGNAD